MTTLPLGHDSMNRAVQDKTANIGVRLTAEDLEVFCDEATRMGLSLACLFGALEDGSEILWMNEEPCDKS